MTDHDDIYLSEQSIAFRKSSRKILPADLFFEEFKEVIEVDNDINLYNEVDYLSRVCETATFIYSSEVLFFDVSKWVGRKSFRHILLKPKNIVKEKTITQYMKDAEILIIVLCAPSVLETIQKNFYLSNSVSVFQINYANSKYSEICD